MQPTQSEGAYTVVSVSRDEEFYFDDSLVVFLVEERLFRVHSHFLIRDSEFFRGLFSLPQPPDTAEGHNDMKPIKLEGVTVHEFKCLLRFLYSGMYGPIISSPEDWIALLSLSTRYVFDKIRDLAIQELSMKVLDPIKKIVLADRHNVPQWLSAAYVDLCKRPEPLTEREADELGLKTVVRVARAREIVREKKYVSASQRSYFPHDRIYAFNDTGILEIVHSVWPESIVKSEKVGTSPTGGLGMPPTLQF
ncbi:hypothetical protein EUX98_g1333 [Antrodiella citrinella]|uniref:BTB domain-containing protein n=1 Tax=Antrodiella citrinella TaxID=2447956 RepID=A0A4S4N1N8_9APHY|nr:hypothetical protein EUX98_g1333 [Antrodiella citrinella]